MVVVGWLVLVLFCLFVCVVLSGGREKLTFRMIYCEPVVFSKLNGI